MGKKGKAISNKGWTKETARNHNAYLYNNNFRLRPEELNCGLNPKYENKTSDDTKIRHAVIKEMEERINNGEELDTIAEEIASRPEIAEQFSYYAKNGIKTPLSTFFKNWYLGKQKNKDANKKLYGLGEK